MNTDMELRQLSRPRPQVQRGEIALGSSIHTYTQAIAVVGTAFFAQNLLHHYKAIYMSAISRVDLFKAQVHTLLSRHIVERVSAPLLTPQGCGRPIPVSGRA
jgi:hypothetical protein